MYEWNYAVQKIIDWIEQNIMDDLSLERLSEKIGYSKYYCSSQFRKITGITIRT